jgi:hypothetical protein
MNSLFSETNTTNAPDSPLPQDQKAEEENTGVNVGVWIFLSFAALALIATAIKGFVPLDLLEVAFWVGLAWLWHKKKIANQTSKILVGILAVLVAGGEGYSIGHYQTGYTYLQGGNIQFRIDKHSGRTDRLWSNGWKPVSIERPTDKINVLDGIFLIPLTNGQWEGQRVCFDVQNKSDYIIKSIALSVTITPKSNADTPTKLSVLSHPEVYGLLDSGDSDRFCGTAITFPGNAEWSYAVEEFTGWKR